MRFHWPKPNRRSPKPIFRSLNMEAITRLVADSLARHGFDRPVDPRRLQWSRWSRCDSAHSLLVVPSKPGIFALAEEVMDLGFSSAHVGTEAFVRPAEPSSAAASSATNAEVSNDSTARRMLAVLRFSEDDDMAFTLDRMFTCANPMRARLASGRWFLRFVVIEDPAQRRSICAALNQWILTSADKTTGLTADFHSTLEFTPDRVGRTLLSDPAGSTPNSTQTRQPLRNLDVTPATQI